MEQPKVKMMLVVLLLDVRVKEVEKDWSLEWPTEGWMLCWKKGQGRLLYQQDLE